MRARVGVWRGGGDGETGCVCCMEGLQADVLVPHRHLPIPTHAHDRVDVGTADEMAIDVLINTLQTLSRENLGIRTLVVGGENDDWPTPRRTDRGGEGSADPMRAALDILREQQKS